MISRRLVPCLALALSFAAACEPEAAGPDGGLIPPFDAGHVADAAPERDAARDPDSGPSSIDAGRDAGAGSDASADVDAGTDASAPDASTSMCPEENLGSAVGDAVATGTTMGDDLSTSCGTAGAPDMVYRWTAPSTGTWLFDTEGSSITALVQIWSNCGMTGGHDCGTGPRLARLTAGASVLLVVEGELGVSGAFVLNIHQAPPTETACDDTIDEDFDGTVDCADSDCSDDLACTETDCGDGLDDDADGDVDCDDVDCDTSSDCVETLCANGLDDDHDGEGDCRDLDCELAPGCVETSCGNGLDDDGDTYADCADYDCAFDAACGEYSCDDAFDDEGDGLTDCADSECRCDVSCFTPAPTCAAMELGSVLGAPAIMGTSAASACGSIQGSCGGDGAEVSLRWTAPSAGSYVFSTNSTAGLSGLYDTVLYVRNGTCTGAELACNDDTSNYQSEVTVALAAGQTVIVVIDTYDVGEGGTWVLNIAGP